MKEPKQPRPPKLTDAERHRRFAETAKKVGASEKSEDFDRAFEGLDIKRPNRQLGIDSEDKSAKP
jgi:hypothetical protein